MCSLGLKKKTPLELGGMLHQGGVHTAVVHVIVHPDVYVASLDWNSIQHPYCWESNCRSLMWLADPVTMEINQGTRTGESAVG